jgi:hypothetical protein
MVRIPYFLSEQQGEKRDNWKIVLLFVCENSDTSSEMKKIDKTLMPFCQAASPNSCKMDFGLSCPK